jgi:chromosome partitioning protein
VRNRAHTPPRDEASFINGGTAGLNAIKPDEPSTKPATSKAKPVSISLAEENLNSIDNVIKEEMLSGNRRVNRSDVVRAAVMALENLSRAEISQLIEKSRLK